MSHHLVEVSDLIFAYPDGKKVLHGVSFRITHGESVAIVGANGAGKSTLLQHLNGYFIPQSGNVHIGELPVTRTTLNNIRKTVGMLFQNSDDQLFMPSVRDDVAFGPKNLGMPDEETEEVVHRSLEKTGFDHLINRMTHKLSGGEKKGVALAGILAMSPDILVMDEPSSGLDPRARKRLIEILRTFSHTKIIATHDLDMALDLCTRVMVMCQGKIVADDTPEKIFSNEKLLLETGLEKPLRMQ